jgi:hypothetical protein
MSMLSFGGGTYMLATTVDDQPQPQQLRALGKANRVRLARAELKRKVAAGEVCAAEVVLECPWEAASMEIGDLLRSQRRWGEARCRRLLVSVGLPEHKQVGTLTDRQRKLLAAVLEAAPDAAGTRSSRLAGHGPLTSS